MAASASIRSRRWRARLVGRSCRRILQGVSGRAAADPDLPAGDPVLRRRGSPVKGEYRANPRLPRSLCFFNMPVLVEEASLNSGTGVAACGRCPHRCDHLTGSLTD